MIVATTLYAQPLVIMDRGDNNRIVNDSLVSIFSSDPNTLILTASFAMKNNTTEPMPLLLKRTINQIPDSTIDFYCFSIQCWFGVDSVTVADTIPPGGESYLFSSHVCHKRYLELALLNPGFSSITYTIFQPDAGAQPVEVSVTVNYLHSPVGFEEHYGRLLTVYPNPSSGPVTVELPSAGHSNYELVLYNSQGAAMAGRLNYFGGDRMEIDTSTLPAGLYTGIISGDGKQIAPVKFIVARN